MGTLSNFAWLRGFWSAPSPAAPILRPARQPETEAAVRIILAGTPAENDPAATQDFARLANLHAADAGGLWVAEAAGNLVSALLPVVSPGRTMLIFIPARYSSELQARLTANLIDGACRRAAEVGVQLAQSLLETGDTQTLPILTATGFLPLAELMYLQATPPRPLNEPALPPGLRWINYSPDHHDLFARTILSTYQQSLDCPTLNGLRHIEDILAGHRATGEFDAARWFLLCDELSPVGALLLSRIPRSDVLELVYLGLPPDRRGGGLGDLLMRRALSVASAARQRLSLAVDSRNVPALKLYWRHGLQVIGRKTAMLRDLRTLPAAPSASQQGPDHNRQ